MTFDAVITAGGRIDGAFATLAGTEVKALAPIGRSTLLSRTIEAVRGSGARRIAVVGGRDVRDACAGTVDKVITEASSGEENVSLALGAWPDAPLLYVASDMPFVAPAALTDFLRRAPANAIAMALADAAAYEAAFPGSAAHATTLAGERVANGSAFYIPAGAASRVARMARSLFAARKSALRMGLLLGPWVALRFGMRRLSVADLEARGRRILRTAVCAVRDCSPALCFDVDSIDDYRYALARA